MARHRSLPRCAAGELDAAIDILGPLMPQIAAHALLPIAVLGDGAPRSCRTSRPPRESGGPLAHFDVSSWNGIAVPAKTPTDVVERAQARSAGGAGQPT